MRPLVGVAFIGSPSSRRPGASPPHPDVPTPPIPLAVDGVILTVAQRDWLDRMISTISAPDPTRTAASILDQSLRAFRKTHRIVMGAWIKRSVVQLGTGPSDAVIVLPPEEQPLEV